MADTSSMRQGLLQIGVVFIPFVVLCFLASYIVPDVTGDRLTLERVEDTEEGTLYGPFKSSTGRLSLELSQDVKGTRDWSWIQAELLDGNRDYLLSVGGEVWEWPESRDETFDADIVVPQDEELYVRVSNPEKDGPDRYYGDVEIVAEDGQWNGDIFMTAAFVGGFIAFVMVFLGMSDEEED